MVVHAGILDKRITIQSRTVVRDAMGGETISWATVQTVWASIEPLKGAELFAAQQVTANLTAKIRVRYRTDIKPYYRLIYGTRIFTIESLPIDPYEGGQELILLCSEGMKES
jgi:SPP1 family predicted phage head-tail adaptor